MKRRQTCDWCWLKKQPAAVQTRAARARFLASSPALRAARPPKKTWPAGTQFCGGCRSFVPTDYVRGSRCQACASAQAHARSVEKTYGISIREYNRLLELQGGRCAICRQVPRSKRLAVDHDHRTGQVRGLLCSGKDRSGCNVALGILHDDVEIVRRALEYLQNPPAQR